MLVKETLERVKHSLIVIVLGAVLSIIPFYFQTRAMTEYNKVKNSEQSEQLETYQQRLLTLEVKGAVDKTEIEQIKKSLNRIELKIDRLIERNESN